MPGKHSNNNVHNFRCSNLSSVEVYDPETNTWTACGRMWAHEGGVGVGAIPFEPI